MPRLTPTEESRSAEKQHSDPHSGRPPICGELVTLPTSVALTAARYANRPGVDPAEIRDVRCTLQAHPTGDHYAFIVEATDATGAWTRWNADAGPEVVLVLPECPATGPEEGAVCSEFESHHGGHTWQVDDPWNHTADD